MIADLIFDLADTLIDAGKSDSYGNVVQKVYNAVGTDSSNYYFRVPVAGVAPEGAANGLPDGLSWDYTLNSGKGVSGAFDALLKDGDGNLVRVGVWSGQFTKGTANTAVTTMTTTSAITCTSPCTFQTLYEGGDICGTVSLGPHILVVQFICDISVVGAPSVGTVTESPECTHKLSLTSKNYCLESAKTLSPTRQPTRPTVTPYSTPASGKAKKKSKKTKGAKDSKKGKVDAGTGKGPKDKSSKNKASKDKAKGSKTAKDNNKSTSKKGKKQKKA